MSTSNSEKSISVLSKTDLQSLVTSDDPLISFKKPMNKRSECWTNYSQVFYSNIPQDYIVCLQCKCLLKWLKDHGTRVMTHHNCSKSKPISSPSSTTTTPTRQRSISSYCTQPSTLKECPLIQKRITEACVEYCAIDGRSFESIRGVGFRNLAKQLVNAGATLGTSVNINKLLPDPTTISRNVEHTYLNLKKQLISLCVSLESFSVTTDFWTAKLTGVHYGGVSLHYIDEQYQLRVFTLACQAYDFETQHSINLRSFVDKILEEYGLFLNEKVFVVSDNENKMKCAFKDDCIRVGCSAHYLNKILQHAFLKNDTKCDRAQLVFKLVRAIISHIRQSHKQSLLPICPVNYSDTRFNGTYLMFNSFLKVYYDLPPILNDEQKKNYLKVDRDGLESLCEYLKEFYKVIEKLSSEKEPTIHIVIPYKQCLINLSVVGDNENQLLIPLKKYIAKELPDYWIVQDIHYIATMLHPNLKSFNHTPQQRYHAETLLQLEFEKYQDSHPPPSSSNENNKRKPIHHQKNSKSLSSLDDIFDLPTSSDELSDEPKSSELDKYLKDKTKIPKNMNVLMYWNDNKLLYPTLYQIAKRVLSIPATNTSIERLFSDSGNTITNRRTRLQTSKVNQLLFIRRNVSLLRELFPPSIEQVKKRKSSSTSVIPMKKRRYSIDKHVDIDLSQEYDDTDASEEDYIDDVSLEHGINRMSQEDDADLELQYNLDDDNLDGNYEKESYVIND